MRLLSLLIPALLGQAERSAQAAGPEPAAWYVGDMHVHRNCGGGTVESVSSIYNTMVNADLDVVSLLADSGNGEVQNPSTDLPLVNGQDASVSTPGRIVHWDTEWHWDATYTQYPHQALGGHIVALGVSSAQQIWNESTGPIFDWAHQHGGIAGFAHFQYLNDDIPQSLSCCTPIEYPVEVALGTCDFISEDVTGGDPFIHAYYRLLNCGFRPGFAAGSDHPCAANVGSCVTFAQVAGGQLSYRGWLNAIAQGRTVVSRNGRGEFVALTVNGTATPGDEIRLSGAGSVTVNVQWTADQNLSGTIELVQNGQVVASRQTSATPSTPGTLTATVNFTKSGWLCARRMGGGEHEVHTAAVFVLVNGAAIRTSVTDAQFYVSWMDTLLQNTSVGGVWASFFPTSRAQAQARYSAARSVFQQIAQEAAGPQPLQITTTSLPTGTLNTPYSTTVTASGGAAPYTWSLASGSLPGGLTLSSAGVIAGTPTNASVAAFSVRVTDSSSPVQTATQALNLTIFASLAGGGIIGNTNDGTSTDYIYDGGPWINACRFQASSNLTVSTMWAKVTAISGKYQCAIYTDSGSQPSRLLCGSAEVSNPAAGWQSFALSPAVTLTNGQFYWLAIWSDNANAWVYYSDTSGTLRWGRYNYGTWPDPIATSGGSNLRYCIYALGPVVAPTLLSIAVTPTNSTLLVGSTRQFTATGRYSDGSTQNLTSQVTWSSSNPGAASIASGGLATGVAAGGTSIGATLSGISGSTPLTVQVPLSLVSLAITPTNVTLMVGATQQYTATGTFSNGNTSNLTTQVTWSSQFAGVATISAGGLATGVSAGTTTITASSGTVGTSTGLRVQPAPLSITTTSLPNGTVNSPYSVTVTASGGAAPYTWSLASGSLPGGLSLSLAGVIAGTPTNASVAAFSVRVTDSSSPVQTATQALNLTIFASLAGGGIIGNTNDGTSTDYIYDGGPWINACRFQASSNLTVSTMWAKVTAISGKYQCAIYTDSGSQPSRLLCGSAEVSNPAAGWQSFALSPAVTLTNGQFYWLAIWSDNANARVYYSDTSGTLRWGRYNYGTWPDPMATSGGANLRYCIYATGVVPPTLLSITVTPASPTIASGATQQFTATGNYSDGTTQNLTTQVTWSSSLAVVANISSVGLATGHAGGATTLSATLGTVTSTTTLRVQAASLVITTTALPNGTSNFSYTATLAVSGGTYPYTWSLTARSLPPGLTLNGNSGTISGTPTVMGTFPFTVQVTDGAHPPQTASQPLGITITVATFPPLLVVTNAANPFTAYYGEILLTEGLNAFEFQDVSTLSSDTLNRREVVLLGQVPLTYAQVTLLTNWVNAGGNLIAMRPDKKLAGLLGLVDLGQTLSESYLLVNSASGPGAGIVSETMQFHGTADRYSLGGASSLATLYTTASTPTASPAVTLRQVGAKGGQAVAFTYDLARSVVLTRQGNPAWADEDRDGISPVRSDDLFYGSASFDPQRDWVDFTKIQIPQADEQQRLLANLILTMDSTRNLLPRFWYFPHAYPAAVVMTGDDHGSGGTAGRFEQYAALSPPGSTVEDWTAIRSSSYMYPATPLTDAQAAAYNAAGFELGVHLNTGCGNYTADSLASMFDSQLSQFRAAFPSLPPQITHRIHCIPWSGYTIAPEVGLTLGIRLDVSYYYWPSNWIQSRPGLFTGSGMPMRFATDQGQLIDVFQAATQMTDESGQPYPATVDALLDNAVGPKGYYGAFVANMHTDYAQSPGSDAIVSSALSRGVPIISARQLLTWLDARNASRFSAISWAGTSQVFTVTAHANARGLVTMVPVPGGFNVSAVKRNGTPVAFTLGTVKGIPYVLFETVSGSYQVDYTGL